jgi:hypothetical protein
MSFSLVSPFVGGLQSVKSLFLWSDIINLNIETNEKKVFRHFCASDFFFILILIFIQIVMENELRGRRGNAFFGIYSALMELASFSSFKHLFSGFQKQELGT